MQSCIDVRKTEIKHELEEYFTSSAKKCPDRHTCGHFTFRFGLFIEDKFINDVVPKKKLFSPFVSKQTSLDIIFEIKMR